MEEYGFGDVDDPIGGARRLRVMGYYILCLGAVPIVCGVLMGQMGFSVLAITLAWTPLLIYLMASGKWAVSQEGCYAGWNWPMTKEWSRYWLDEGHLEELIEKALIKEMLPFVKGRMWSYHVVFELSEGVRIGVSRLYGSRTYDLLMVHVEGINELNTGISSDVHALLTNIMEREMPIVEKVVYVPAPADCVHGCSTITRP